MFKWFRNAGFVTGYYEDFKPISTFTCLKKGFHYSPADHYFKPFATNIEQHVGKAWATDFCYLMKGIHEWLGDWVQSFLEKYVALQAPHFLFSWTTIISHENVTTLGFSDEYHYKLLRHLDESQSLNKTIFLFLSDHGYRYGSFRSTEVGQHEENSPIMNWVIPKWFKHKYKKEMMNFQTNAKYRLTSVYDIHRTMLDFADGALDSAIKSGMKDYGKSLFKPIDKMRTCSDAGIPDHFCGCRTAVPHPLTDPLSIEAGIAVVNYVNTITSSVEGSKCMVYRLRHIIAAYKHKRYDIEGTTEVAVTVAMTPSSAEFSATVHLFPDGSQSAEVKGISRVSLYGNTADCVDDAQMRLYCTCK